MGKNIATVVFWGAAWGLVEATLGYGLHSLSIGIGWLLWFPLAFYFMRMAYKQTGSPASILSVSAIAAAIKLVNLLLPARLDRVINPAASIILEGLALFAVVVITERQQGWKEKCALATVASIGWRVLYTVYILFMPTFFFDVSPLSERGSYFQFLVVESLVNSAVIFSFMIIGERTSAKSKVERAQRELGTARRVPAFFEKRGVFRTALSFALLALAVFVQWAL